jgi:cell filamentation protein
MSKGNSQFCLSEYLAICKDKVEFAKKIAYYQSELIALHLFYELNGRTLRLFFDLLSIFNGYKAINYSGSIDNGKYIEASIDCVQYADTTKMENIIFNGLSQ